MLSPFLTIIFALLMNGIVKYYGLYVFMFSIILLILNIGYIIYLYFFKKKKRLALIAGTIYISIIIYAIYLASNIFFDAGSSGWANQIN